MEVDKADVAGRHTAVVRRSKKRKRLATPSPSRSTRIAQVQTSRLHLKKVGCYGRKNHDLFLGRCIILVMGVRARHLSYLLNHIS